MLETTPDPARVRLEAWLADSEGRFRTIFELAGAGVVITRGDASISYANQAFARMLGYTTAELIGRQLIDIASPDQERPLRAGIAALRAGTATAVTLERTYLHRDGHYVAAAVSVHMLPIPPELAAAARADKMLSRFVGITQDITSRKRAEAQLLENQRLLEEAQRLGKIGHWTWNPATSAVTWSDELHRILGVVPGSHPLRPGGLEAFIVPEDLPIVRSAFNSMMAGESSTAHEFRVRRADGEFRDVIGRSIAERSPDGTLVRIVGTMQDITERKHHELMLREAMNNAETANRAKTKFLAAMSHELRTPLNAILGFAELLSLRAHGTLTPAQASYVANIIQGGEHLLHLINDVLDLARIDTGKLMLNVDRIDVDALLREVMEDFRPMADARDVALDFSSSDGPVIANADRTRLTQVLVNLVSNAIKYNRPQGSVNFRLERPRQGCVRLAVEDTGRGIPKERQTEVFESFNRLGAEITGEEGTGIGLSLSKRLVEEMGGAIGFRSTVGCGSVFWVDLSDESAIDAATIEPLEARTLAG